MRDVGPCPPAELEARWLLARQAAEAASVELTVRRQGLLTIEKKGAVDLVTAADRAAEDILIAMIQRGFPGDAVHAEESGHHSGGSAWRWVVDPLDGTTNYVHGLPNFAVSVGVTWHGTPVIGVIDAPLLGKRYHAALGHGAWIGDQRLATSACATLSEALLATGFPYDRQSNVPALLAPLGRTLAVAQGLRRMGSAALDLAAVAEGMIDGYWEPRLKPWDVMAGIVLVREAGGVVSAFDGAPQDGKGPTCDIVAASRELYPALLQLVIGEDTP
jgi:myo-inositol-1(or 4)-monophosphatase